MAKSENNNIKVTLLSQEKIQQLQVECLSARKTLFWKDDIGFDYNGIDFASSELTQIEEERINRLTDGFVTFTFCSHNCLYFTLRGYDKVHIFSASKHMLNLQGDEIIDSRRNTPYKSVAKELEKALIEYEKAQKHHELVKEDITPIVYAGSEVELINMNDNDFKAIAYNIKMIACEYGDNLYFTATRQLINEKLKNAFGGEYFRVSIEVDECSRLYLNIHTRFDDKNNSLGNSSEVFHPLIKTKGHENGNKKDYLVSSCIKAWEDYKKMCKNACKTMLITNSDSTGKKDTLNNITSIMKNPNLKQVAVEGSTQPTIEEKLVSHRADEFAHHLVGMIDENPVLLPLLKSMRYTPGQALEQMTNGMLTCKIESTRINLTVKATGTMLVLPIENMSIRQTESILATHLCHLLTVGEMASNDQGTDAPQSDEKDVITSPLTYGQAVEVADSESFSGPTIGVLGKDALTMTRDAQLAFNTDFKALVDIEFDHICEGKDHRAMMQRVHAFVSGLAKKHGYKGKKSKTALLQLLNKDCREKYDELIKLIA